MTNKQQQRVDLALEMHEEQAVVLILQHADEDIKGRLINYYHEEQKAIIAGKRDHKLKDNE